MRLFHVSEEPDITRFEPRLPTRDVGKDVGLVWAVDEARLPNFLTPRNCPRVAYHANKQTTESDLNHFFTSTSRHCVIVENTWFSTIAKTTLFVYEFDPKNFCLLDDVAGYYVSEHIETPVHIRRVEDVFAEHFARDVELRFVNNLWQMAERVQKSTLGWSLCRMRYAQK